jgi:hypothetical protein
MKAASLLIGSLGICCVALAAAPEPDLVSVVSRQVSRMTDLPGDSFWLS